MSLIWMLYGIDLLSNISVALGVAWVLGLIAGVIALIVMGNTAGNNGDETLYRLGVRSLRICITVIALALPLDICIPGKSTMYAMAAVSVGEKLADNPAVQGIASDGLKAVQIWINRQLTEAKKSQ
jgi:hypothetical protein